ncbi:MAG: glutamate racemase [Candidatus Gastranaerophilales bacterium]|nr:glutamate racemase [Candidatus Gastranaerophilales bacterium]
MNRPIGVFDSGVGGLTVLKKLTAEMPEENYIYFGDTARVPYGEKSKEQLLGFGREILDWYKKNDVKMVLMACNTSSSVILDIVQKEYDFPVLGLIKPTAQYIASLDVKKIGLIATSATVKSNAYQRAINKLDSSMEVYQIPCPGLVEIVESGKINEKESRVIISKYITPLIEKNVEKIILGCTHYPYFENIIFEITHNNGLIIDPGEYLVSAAKEKLNEMNLNNTSGVESRKYYVSSNPEKFVSVGSKFFSDCKKAEQISF